MTYMPGGDLNGYIKQYTYLNECLAYIIFSQLVDVVSYLHKNYIIHRDIKLDNILYDTKENKQILDYLSFGCYTILI